MAHANESCHAHEWAMLMNSSVYVTWQTRFISFFISVRWITPINMPLLAQYSYIYVTQLNWQTIHLYMLLDWIGKWFIYICYSTELANDSFIYVTRLNWQMIHLHMLLDWDSLTHSYVCHDSIIFVLLLTHICAIIRVHTVFDWRGWSWIYSTGLWMLARALGNPLPPLPHPKNAAAL